MRRPHGGQAMKHGRHIASTACPQTRRPSCVSMCRHGSSSNRRGTRGGSRIVQPRGQHQLTARGSAFRRPGPGHWAVRGGATAQGSTPTCAGGASGRAEQRLPSSRPPSGGPVDGDPGDWHPRRCIGVDVCGWLWVSARTLEQQSSPGSLRSASLGQGRRYADTGTQIGFLLVPAAPNDTHSSLSQRTCIHVFLHPPVAP